MAYCEVWSIIGAESEGGTCVRVWPRGVDDMRKHWPYTPRTAQCVDAARRGQEYACVCRLRLSPAGNDGGTHAGARHRWETNGLDRCGALVLVQVRNENGQIFRRRHLKKRIDKCAVPLNITAKIYEGVLSVK
jgi:hypothetical protein